MNESPNQRWRLPEHVKERRVLNMRRRFEAALQRPARSVQKQPVRMRPRRAQRNVAGMVSGFLLALLIVGLFAGLSGRF